MADAAADIEERAPASLDTVKDLFSGAAGGIAQVLLGKWTSGWSIGDLGAL